MPFSPAQVAQLLAPIKETRVLQDGKGNSHLPQQDVLAHLTRIFGFGSFDYEMLSCELLFESQRPPSDQQKRAPWKARYDVAYKAFMRLTVRDPEGNVVCKFEDGSTGDASNQTRADAHDLAMKSAISLAKKRCAIALGDQFGLSLYNKGQTSALVKVTLVDPRRVDAADETDDVQKDVPAPASMGIDETDRELHVVDDQAGASPADQQQSTRQPPTRDRARAHLDASTGATGASSPATLTGEAAAERENSLRADLDSASTREALQSIWRAANVLPKDAREALQRDVEKKAGDLSNTEAPAA